MRSEGVLYIVATPIGHLGDMSLRAIEILKAVDIIAAEDTRHSANLLRHFGIETKKMKSLHEHNEKINVSKWIACLEQGKSLALISDAGTPLISDPGYHLVRHVREKGIRIVPIPGPCAAIAALSVSGLPTDRFVFEGFLPAKPLARINRLIQLKEETRTMIFYEAPHRVLASLKDMETVFGANRYGVLARELTKTFETVVFDVLSALIAWMASHPEAERGEFVILVEGEKAKRLQEIQAADLRILEILQAELPDSQAVKLAAKITGKKKNALYKLLISK